MKVYKMVFSPTGGTEKSADLLLKSWEEEQTAIDLLERERDFSYFPRRMSVWRRCLLMGEECRSLRQKGLRR